MNAQSINDSVLLLRWALVIGSTVLTNYLLWALGAGSALGGFVVLLLLGEFIVFLAFRPLSAWPIKILLVSMLLIMLSTPTPAWDARTTWLYHAKRIYLSGDLYNLLDGYPPWSHGDYPALAAALSASLAQWVGAWNEIFPKSANLFVAIAPVLILASFLQSLSQKLLLVFGILLLCANNIINGYMDGLLALHFAAAAMIISALCGLDENSQSTPREYSWLVGLGIVIISAMTLLKNEGAAGLFALTVAASVCCVRDRKFFVMLRLWAIAAVAMLPLLWWKIMCSHQGVETGLDPAGMGARILKRITSPHDVAEIVVALLLRFEFVAPAGLLLAFLVLGLFGKPRLFPILGSAVYLTVIATVYLGTPLDLEWHLRTSADRTMLPVVALLAFLCLHKIGSSAVLRILREKWTRSPQAQLGR